MTKIILVRCGSTDWNRSGRIQGNIDVPLDERGCDEVEKTAMHLADTKVSAVYSSDLSRCYTMARRIAARKKLKVTKVRELKEYHQGLWQGLLIDDIRKRYKKHFALWQESPFLVTPPKGESPKEAYDRVISAVQKLIDKNEGNTFCIVTHQLASLIIKCHFHHLDFKGKIWQYNLPPGGWEVIDIEEHSSESLILKP